MIQFHIAAFYASLFGILFIVSLTLRFDRLKRLHGKDAGKEIVAAQKQDIFAEYIPLSLLLVWMLETMQAPPRLLHVFGAVLLAGRVLQLYGLSAPETRRIFQRAGSQLILLQILFVSFLCLLAATNLVQLDDLNKILTY